MKSCKYLLVIVLLLHRIAGYSQPPTNIVGSWKGELKIGAGLRIAMHIRKDSAGHYTTMLDSPDQQTFGIPSDTTIITGDSVYVDMRRQKAYFSGRLQSDTLLAGIFFQGIAIPLQLTRGTFQNQSRPQTPRPPFPYSAKEVIYHSADGSRKFGATITIPAGQGPFPAALLISGSGPQDRDEDIFGHKIFAIIADHLTRNGIIVLRVDDRGVGKTSGNFSTATSADFADDVLQGLAYLQTREEVNRQKIGLVGHSEGGMIAEMLAAKSSELDFIILLAAPGVKTPQLMAEQNNAILQSAGISEKARKKYAPLYTHLMEAIVSAPDTVQAVKAANTIMQQWLQQTDTALLKELGLQSATGRTDMLHSFVYTFSASWFKYFLQYDPAPYLENLHIKVLALNGSKDLQVISASNLAGIRKALRKSKSPQYDVQEIKGLNHLFQTCNTCTLAEYKDLEESFSPAVLKIMSDWLSKYVK